MTYLAIAYGLIAVTLVGYGISLYQRMRSAERSIRALEERD